MNKFVWMNIFLAISATFILSVGKIISLQKNYVSEDNGVQNTYQERGPIFDRNGNILAMQVNSWHVGLRLIDTEYPDEAVKILSEVLSIPLQELQEKLDPPTRYVRIKKFISKQEHDALMVYKNDGALRGIQINNIPWRQYPGNDSIAHVIGYYGEAQNGLDGIEATYNSYLTPSQNNIGNSVYLTIDSVLQKSIEQIVKETLEESQSSYITTILMNAKTGDILSYVAEPSFDLNKYYTYPQSKLSNKIISHNYEPGSVFKIFSMASVLDANIVSIDTTYNANTPYVDPKYGFVIRDVYYPGVITTSGIIKYSSNVGVSLATYNMESDLLYDYLRNFGFGEKTGIKMPGESPGVFLNTSHWSARSKQTIALGQEIAVTAMQMATAATAISNNGILLSPKLVDKIVDSTGNIIYRNIPTEKRRVISSSTANTLLAMMNSATEPGGTARRLRIPGINISAKTGTAQVFDVEKKSYSDTNFIASTISIVPTEDPELIVYAVIHNPTSGEIYGGRTTAPMIKKMLNFILPYLGMVGNSVTMKNTNNQPSRSTPPHFLNTKYYDNYVGLKKREIWPLFANTNVVLNTEGNGTVVTQDPPAGTLISQNNTLTLYLE